MPGLPPLRFLDPRSQLRIWMEAKELAAFSRAAVLLQVPSTSAEGEAASRGGFSARFPGSKTQQSC